MPHQRTRRALALVAVCPLSPGRDRESALDRPTRG